ncbi:hypothetical protein [Aquibacillus albus]|uniref:Uncharacterized protein n=1 Tax=Aquibacillus albus TaxID=1168171 RepID=A0ABS2N5A9_9BACI|nr:hypothetical protein [Aquibacillus albus]MBM7573339.1 hypothetical protein [Aquibacillus albus]
MLTFIWSRQKQTAMKSKQIKKDLKIPLTSAKLNDMIVYVANKRKTVQQNK